MYKLYCFLLFLILSISTFSQDTTNVSITNYALVEGQTFSWRGTGTFHNMTSWNSTAYTQGYLRYFQQFVLNYRLLFPNRGGSGYNPNYEPGYPLIVMIHGAGERGNCWGNSCYYGNSTWNPNDPPVGTPDLRLLNNDHNLLHGGQPHLAAVDLAGTRLPDDPSLPSRAFPGFVLFPQNVNGWTGSSIDNTIRLIRLLMKTHNIDPNRIYIHGLSNGGFGAYLAMMRAPWMFAAAAPMSAIDAQTLLGANGGVGINSVSPIPMWIFQGALDGAPRPSQTESLIRDLRNAGANVRYKKYPNLGHGVWNTAYNEPDFFSWLLSKNKANIHVDFDSPFICGTNGAGASLRLPVGFPAYQWERDGQLIPGATSASYIATIPGTYRARFSRTHANPSEEQWNRWSDPVLVSERTPQKPELEQIGTVVLPNLNNVNDPVLTAVDKEQAKYFWYQNGNLLTVSDQTTTLVNVPRIKSTIVLRTSGFDNCQSQPSDPKYLFFNPPATEAAPANITRPNNFVARITSPTSVLLTWNDNSGNERGFEVWRQKSTDPTTAGWVMATLTSEDVVSFHDTGLEPNTTYLYKIRAVSNNGRSIYWPSDTRNRPATSSNFLIVNTGTSTVPPAPPQNLTATTTLDQPPISFAGCNQTLRLAKTATTLPATTINTEDPALFIENYSGNYSIDPDGYIVSYLWKQVSGPVQVRMANVNSPALIISGAVEGTYVFSLETTDDNGSTDLDFVTINAVRWTSRVRLTNGSTGYMDIRIGIGSINHDFRVTWNTSRTTTASQFASNNDNIDALSALGINLASSGESIYFTNNIPLNFNVSIIDGPGSLGGVISDPQAPIANAGPDRTITNNSITLSGYSLLRSAEENQSIIARSWSQVSGPNNVSWGNHSGTSPRQRTASGLIPGTYVFRFTVTDNTIHTSFDDVTVVVSPPQNALSAKLSWDEGLASNKEYYIYYGSDSVSTGVNTNAFVINNLPPNKNYTFTVKAVDQFGNLSPASNQVVATTYFEGLQYQHTTGVWNNASDQPDINLITWNQPEFRGTIDDFNINSPEENPPGVRTQADFFNFRFDGFFYAHLAGQYRFQTVSNEVARVTVNGIQRTLIQTGTDVSQTSTSGDVSLGVGPHRITVEFADYQGDHELQVRYRLPGQSVYNNIPLSRIRSFDVNNPPVEPTPPNPPQNLAATGVSMTQVDVSWQAPATGSAYKVVVLGSSTAAGTPGPSPISNSWVNRFTTWLQGIAPGSSVTNLAVGGYTTNSVLPTVNPSTNITAALALNPHIILVNLPSNDVTSGIPLSTTMANFRTIKKLADNVGVKMFITTAQPRDIVGGSTELTSQQRELLKITADSIRAAFGQYVIDIYDELTDFTNDRRIKPIYRHTDGIHLNNAGHDYIFTTARDKIIPHLLNYEVYRSTSELTGYELVTRTAAMALEDKNLIPGTYWYKVRTVDFNGVSIFTPAVSASTFTDNIAPSVPSGVTITAKTFTNVSLVWNASTDNVGVTGYEVFANGVLIGSTDIIGYLATDLVPNTLYNFTIKAFDASGNRSETSTPVSTTTNNYTVFYSKVAGNLNQTTNWGIQSDGGGTAPPGFDHNGQHFVVSNRTTSSLGGVWTVEGGISKVIVPDGVTLTADNAFTARVEVQGTGTVVLDNTTIPEFISLSNNSTVQYNAASFIQTNTYGHLALGGSGTKTFFSGTTTVNGNLTVGNNISLKGGPGNSTRLMVGGNVSINGAPQFVADDFGIKMELTGTGNKTISSAGDIYLDEIIISGTSLVNVVSTSSPYNIRLGGEASGGLTLATNSRLSIGNNSLYFKKRSAINPANETGRIAISGGNIFFTSTSVLPSNLYFDPTANAINRFEVNTTGGGTITIREAARITDGLKIQNGNINANGQLMLVSTASKTANLEIIENSGQVTGDLIVQRHMAPEGRIWKYISSPVDGVTVADWQQSFPITGAFTGASTGPGLGSSPSMYYYNETQGGWIPYPPPGGTNQAPILRGVGYSVFIRNDQTPTLIQVDGPAYQKNIPFVLTGGTGGNNGWNLLGNPYASTIAWSNTGWSLSGLSSTVSVRNNPDGVFLYYDAATGIGTLPGGKIASGQAFWVQATTANPSLTISEQAKSLEQQEFYREGDDKEYAMVRLIRGSQEDVAFILFDNSSDTYQAEKDAFKRTNEGMFSFSTLSSDGIPLAINKLNETFCVKSVNLKFENVPAGQYKIVLENIESLSRIQRVVLHDNLLNTSVSSGEYTFEITSDAATWSTSRFTVKFERSQLSMPVLQSASAVCAEPYSTVVLSNTEYGSLYTLVNPQGEVLVNAHAGENGNTVIQLPTEKLAFGNNAVRVLVTDAVCDGTPVIAPGELTIVRNIRPEVTISNELTICSGSSTTLNASGSDGTIGYKWFSEVGEHLSTGNFFVTPELFNNKIYRVAAVGPNGCEGAQKAILINTEVVAIPQITVVNDTMFTASAEKLQWYKDGQPIFSVTGTFYTPEESGSYRVSSSSMSGGCVQFSDEVIFVVTSTEPITGGLHGLHVFPNPASKEIIQVSFETSERGPVELKLVDTFGRTVYHQQHTHEDARHGIIISSATEWSAGLYLVIGTQGKSSITKKLIIK